jgi:uncharacterized membrane protein
MTVNVGWVIKVISVAAVVAYPFVLHFFVVKNATGALGVGLALLPIAGYLFWLMKTAQHRLRTALVLALGAVLLWAGWASKLIDFSAAYFFEHLLFNSLLMILFGASLLPGREPLISNLARRVHGSLPSEIAAYTVSVTWLWTIYFAATVVISLLLYNFSSLTVWSFFANVLGIPLAIVVFVGEYFYRVKTIRNFPHVSIFKGMQAMTQHADEKSQNR